MGEREYGVIDESTFRDVASDMGWDTPETLASDQVYLIDPFYDERFSENVTAVELDGVTHEVASRYEKTPLNVMTFGGLLLVTPDDVFTALPGEALAYQAVSVADYKEQTALSESLSIEANFSSATALYSEAMTVHGALLFVGSFLGLVLLVATGSIIYFKTMTEAEEDRAKYAVLRKVVISKRDVKRTIRQQIAVVFLAPFSLGIVHASVALVAFSRLLAMDFTLPVLVWMGVYSAIYALYYVLTVRRFTKQVI